MKRLISVFVLFLAFLYSCRCFGQTYVLYGLTEGGGTKNYGTLFTYNLTIGKDSVLLNFNNTNGAMPYGNVIVDPTDGKLFGVTTAGGSKKDGVLFSYDPVTGKDSVRFSFDSLNGKGPEYGGLTFYNNLLYGMTLYGGNHGWGTLFNFDPITGKDSVYINFDTTGKMPYYPAGLALTPYSNGLFYGMTYAGGTHNRGTIISFNPVTGICSTIVDLDSTLGVYPIEGTLVLNKKNNLLYGITYKGGAKNLGVIFCFNPGTGKDSVVGSFTGPNGSLPYGSLVYDTVNGLFYGMNSSGGTKTGGVLFSFDPITGKDSTIFNFTGPNGAVPLGDLILGPGNNLYGMTLYGGTSNLGVLFRYNTVSNKDTILVNFTGPNGASPYGSLTLAKALVVTSMAYVEGANSLLIYPNPAENIVNLVFTQEGKHVVELDDIAGRKINCTECFGKNYTLPIGGLAKGIYFIRSLSSNNRITVTKLIKL